jgi:hypothetical protein
MLLLTGIVKETKPHHPDYENLKIALEKVKEVTDYVNDTIKSNEKLQLFMEMVNKGNFKHLMHEKDGRKFVSFRWIQWQFCRS